MRRLYSSFARGWPGGGLLLLRIVAAVALLQQAYAGLRSSGLGVDAVPVLIGAAAGVLLLIGLWTPIAGAVVAATEIWLMFGQSGEPWRHILVGSIGAALALLGPGHWSLDARIFGWKRIEIGKSKK